MTNEAVQGNLPLALRLLDHQVDGPDGAALAKVDDIELTVGPDGLTATALLCGPGALGERLPGRLGQWTLAGWRRLTMERYPQPIRIPLMEVRRVSAVVTVTPEAAKAVQRQLTVERWLLENLISRLPAAGAEPHPTPEPRQRGTAELDAKEPGARTIRLSRLLEFEASGTDGASLGRIHEVIVTRPSATTPVLGALPVVGFIVGPRNTGSTMGYDRHPEHGPWLLRVGVLALHRRDVEVPADDVAELDIAHRRITTRHAPAPYRRGPRS